MEKIIKVKDSQIEGLLAFYEKQQAGLREEIKAAKETLKKLQQKYEDGEAVINELSEDSVNGNSQGGSNGAAEKNSKKVDPITGEYPKTGSWWEKIRWVLGKHQKVLSASEIADSIYKRQQELVASVEDKRLADINIFATLSNKYRNKKIARIKEDGDFKYAFNEWFDEDDTLMPKYYE